MSTQTPLAKNKFLIPGLALTAVVAAVGYLALSSGESAAPFEAGRDVAVLADASMIVLKDGEWWEAAPAGAWSKVNTATVKIKAPAPPFKLQVKAVTFPAARPLTLLVNGTEVGKADLRRDYTTPVFDVPATVGADCCTLTFKLDEQPLVSPKDIGESEDARPLAFMLSTLRIDPAQ